MKENKRRVAIYLRSAIDEKDISSMNRILLEFCKLRNWRVYKIFSDDIDGIEIRKEYNNMMYDARNLLFDIVLFWNYSRFSKRDTIRTLADLKELETLGIRWKSYQESYLDSASPFKETIYSLMTTVHSTGKEHMRESTKIGMKKSTGKLGRRSIINQRQINNIITYYRQSGSINKASKLSGLSWATCKKIINNNVRTVKDYKNILKKRRK